MLPSDVLICSVRLQSSHPALCCFPYGGKGLLKEVASYRSAGDSDIQHLKRLTLEMPLTQFRKGSIKVRPGGVGLLGCRGSGTLAGEGLGNAPGITQFSGFTSVFLASPMQCPGLESFRIFLQRINMSPVGTEARWLPGCSARWALGGSDLHTDPHRSTACPCLPPRF